MAILFQWLHLLKAHHTILIQFRYQSQLELLLQGQGHMMHQVWCLLSVDYLLLQ